MAEDCWGISRVDPLRVPHIQFHPSMEVPFFAVLQENKPYIVEVLRLTYSGNRFRDHWEVLMRFVRTGYVFTQRDAILYPVHPLLALALVASD